MWCAPLLLQHAQAFQGLAYLHSHNILHCDLKPDNFLFTSSAPDAELKICDFGLSRYIGHNKYYSEIAGASLPPFPASLAGWCQNT